MRSKKKKITLKKKATTFLKKKGNYPKNFSLQEINYKNVAVLSNFISEQGRILPAKVTMLTAKKQRALALSIKRARFMSLMAYQGVQEL